VAVFEYGGRLAHSLHRLKYYGQLSVARSLGSLMSGHLRALRPDLVVPVPMHRARLRSRGFNHSTELGRYACRCTDIPLTTTSLKRTELTVPQARLPLHRRQALSSRSFRVAKPKKLSGKKIVLLDDVMTTGATATACSRTLLRAGAAEVSVVVLARTIRC
jgi:ComF family protein